MTGMNYCDKQNVGLDMHGWGKGERKISVAGLAAVTSGS